MISKGFQSGPGEQVLPHIGSFDETALVMTAAGRALCKITASAAQTIHETSDHGGKGSKFAYLDN